MTLYASAFVIIPYIYIAWRLINSAGLLFPSYSRISRIIILSVILLVNIFPLLMLYYYSKGTLLNEFIYKSQTNLQDYFFLFPFWIGLIIIIEVLPYFIASDILQLLGKWFFSGLNPVVRKWSAIFKVVLLLFFAIYVSVNTFIDTYKISESKFSINIDDLPAELNNLNLALIADLQIDRFTQNYKIDSVKELINGNKPDLLFFAGDLVTRGKDFINQGVDFMCGLQANTERVACIGDHDYWADAEIISKGLENCGWTFLYDAHSIISYKNSKILVTGITYIYSRRISPGQLKDVLQNAPDADLKILLVHQPSKMVVQFAEEYGYDILLAGHTHGGQVVFKPFGFTLTPTKIENEFYSGYYKKNRLNIFVTNGVGLTMMPLRYRASAEVIKINLQN